MVVFYGCNDILSKSPEKYVNVASTLVTKCDVPNLRFLSVTFFLAHGDAIAFKGFILFQNV